MRKELLDHYVRLSTEEQEILENKRVNDGYYFSQNRSVVDKTRLLSKGQFIAIRPHPRYVFFPPHSHNYVEVVYMLSGTTTHRINGAVELVLQTGELLMMNQHVHHAINAAGEGDIAINFLILPQFFDTSLQLIDHHNPLGKFLLGGLQKDGGEISYLHFKVTQITEVQNLIENLLLGHMAPGPNQAALARNTMELLFLHLLEYTGVMHTDTSHLVRNTMVVECLQEIEDRYMSASLSDVAEKYNVSTAYLSNLVKNTMGQNFKSLLQEKRLSQAEMLLRHTQLSITEVIAAVGYQNSSHFYRLFKQRYGALPGQWRQ